MESNLTYYLALMALIIIGVIVAKKVVGCLIKSVITLILTAIGIAIYWCYLR